LKKGILFLTAGLLLASAPPVAEAAPKRNCGNRCEMDYDTCLKNAHNRAARKSCRASHKLCKRVCY